MFYDSNIPENERKINYKIPSLHTWKRKEKEIEIAKEKLKFAKAKKENEMNF